MNQIISDKEITISELNPRKAVRALIINSQGEILVNYLRNKNLYTIPGGGIEIDETKEQALKREVLEETGYEVISCKYLCSVEEYRSKIDFSQINYGYVVKVGKDKQALSLTDKELNHGLENIWMSLDTFIQKLSEEDYSDYFRAYIIKRDQAFIKMYQYCK